jgi:group II intron reverse transcriptase/maturase
VASEIDRSWLQNEQRKLYARSNEKPEYVFCKLWGLVTDLHNLRVAVARVASNRGQRTAGVDGITVRKVIAPGVDAFVEGIRRELRSGSYRPDPVRRVLIPKAGQPGKYRALGIPTVKDRVVQAAMKNILEPIFEADFYPVSYGFRPSKSAHEAVEHLRKLLRPQTADRRSPYQWAIEGDIKACFDNISHHGLMERIRRRVGDAKVNRLVVAFLKAGILSEAQFTRTETGTPQGGILSPLLANIALSAIEERYERWVWPRRNPTFVIDAAATSKRAQDNRCTDRGRGIVVCFPVRYADDFIILIGAPRGQEHRAREIALQEKAAIATMLVERLGLELSEAKTLITSVMQPMRFLGHSIRVRRHPSRRKMVSTAVIPKARSQHLRERIKALFRRSSLGAPLSDRLRLLNPLLRGWGNFYRHAWGASHVFSGIDHFVWWTIFRWIRKKHHGVTMKVLRKRYGWSKPGRRSLKWKDGDVHLFELAAVRVGPFMARHYRARPHPYSAFTSMESPMHSERCTSGSGEGARKPAGDDHRQGAERPSHCSDA